MCLRQPQLLVCRQQCHRQCSTNCWREPCRCWAIWTTTTRLWRVRRCLIGSTSGATRWVSRREAKSGESIHSSKHCRWNCERVICWSRMQACMEPAEAFGCSLWTVVCLMHRPMSLPCGINVGSPTLPLTLAATRSTISMLQKIFLIGRSVRWQFRAIHRWCQQPRIQGRDGFCLEKSCFPGVPAARSGRGFSSNLCDTRGWMESCWPRAMPPCSRGFRPSFQAARPISSSPPTACRFPAHAARVWPPPGWQHPTLRFCEGFRFPIDPIPYRPQTSQGSRCSWRPRPKASRGGCRCWTSIWLVGCKSTWLWQPRRWGSGPAVRCPAMEAAHPSCGNFPGRCCVVVAPMPRR